MLTKLVLHNFKQFESAEIDLGDAVVFVGPNNSGKTTALQALTLWDVGWRRWLSKRRGSKAQARPGVAINRRDLLAVPVPSGRLLWRDLSVRNVSRENGDQVTRNVLLGVVVEGITAGNLWRCGLEFDYANEESFYVRPMRMEDPRQGPPIPREVESVRVAFLPPMSGLASEEFLKQPGEISVLIGQGQTAQVLRNMCFQVCFPGGPTAVPSSEWVRIVEEISRLFGVTLLEPTYYPERGEIRIQFREGDGPLLDLSASGRGLQQTLLLLAYIYGNPRTVLLLDEPDAHLEVLRQRQTYQLVHAIAREQNAQIIAASHSEVVLQEAASTGSVVAFVGTPHVLTGQPTQVLKSLTSIGWDQYYQAELTGWVLYVEDATDLTILKAFAQVLGHPAREHLDRCFVHYLGTNIPQRARDHFFGIREAKPDFRGVAIFDRLDRELHEGSALTETSWKRREIENYIASEQVLLRWAGQDQPMDLFSLAERDDTVATMRSAIAKVTDLLMVDNKEPWSADTKASDEVLDRVFRVFFHDRGLPVAFRKADYHELVGLLRPDEVDSEVSDKLDLIVNVATRAKPRT